MKKTKIEVAIEAAKLIKVNPVWRSFKAKWDGKTPRKNSKAFIEFALDADEAQRSNQAIYDKCINDFC